MVTTQLEYSKNMYDRCIAFFFWLPIYLFFGLLEDVIEEDFLTDLFPFLVDVDIDTIIIAFFIHVWFVSSYDCFEGDKYYTTFEETFVRNHQYDIDWDILFNHPSSYLPNTRYSRVMDECICNPIYFLEIAIFLMIYFMLDSWILDGDMPWIELFCLWIMTTNLLAEIFHSFFYDCDLNEDYETPTALLRIPLPSFKTIYKKKKKFKKTKKSIYVKLKDAKCLKNFLYFKFIYVFKYKLVKRLYRRLILNQFYKFFFYYLSTKKSYTKPMFFNIFYKIQSKYSPRLYFRYFSKWIEVQLFFRPIFYKTQWFVLFDKILCSYNHDLFQILTLIFCKNFYLFNQHWIIQKSKFLLRVKRKKLSLVKIQITPYKMVEYEFTSKTLLLKKLIYDFRFKFKKNIHAIPEELECFYLNLFKIPKFNFNIPLLENKKLKTCKKISYISTKTSKKN